MRTHSVTVQRTVYASPERAFDAWRLPEALNEWFTTAAQVDFRIGGSYSDKDGNSGVYLTIEEHRRLRFSWINKKHQPGSRVTVHIIPKSYGYVTVRLRHGRLKSERDSDELMTYWLWALDSLAAYLETGDGILFHAWKGPGQ